MLALPQYKGFKKHALSFPEVCVCVPSGSASIDVYVVLRCCIWCLCMCRCLCAFVPLLLPVCLCNCAIVTVSLCLCPCVCVSVCVSLCALPSVCSGANPGVSVFASVVNIAHRLRPLSRPLQSPMGIFERKPAEPAKLQSAEPGPLWGGESTSQFGRRRRRSRRGGARFFSGVCFLVHFFIQ